MNHADHVDLLRNGVSAGGGVWADLGAGSGAFTLALAELLGEGTIYAVDKNGRSLKTLTREMHNHFPHINLITLKKDFTKPLELPPLDGIVMANSLHFLRRKDETLQKARGYLQENGRFLLVEYNVDKGNMWVPHPFSFSTWQQLAHKNGWQTTALLATKPSRFLHQIYSALSY